MDKLFGRAKQRLSRRLSPASSAKPSRGDKGDVAEGAGESASTQCQRSLASPGPRITRSSHPQAHDVSAKPDDAPPAYSAAAPASEYTRANVVQRGDDPYYFLYLFDTVFLIDDSSSMVGRRWREVDAALRQLAPVCTSHDDDGIDVYFMNHESTAPPPDGKPPSGYYNMTDAAAVAALFARVRPFGPTPTRARLEAVLDAYFAALRRAADVRDVRPLNLIVVTDGMPGPATPAGDNPHLPEPAIVAYARELDRLAAPPYQVGIQFVQVGGDAGATRALERLDCLQRRYGIRDMVDTTKYAGGRLTADAILKAVLGGVDRRLDGDSRPSSR